MVEASYLDDDGLFWIRQSELASFMNCKRRTWLSYWRGLQPVQYVTGVADTGTICHVGLEALYNGQDPLTAMALWYAEQPELIRPLLKENYDLAVIMVSGYMDWLEETGEDAGMTVTAVEREIEIPFNIVDGVQVMLTGKVDLEYVDMFDQPMLMDHKSVDKIMTVEAAAMDYQRLTYSVMRLMEDGTVYKGAVHNQLRRVKRGPQSKPPYYGRNRVSFNIEQLRNHYKHMMVTVEELVRAKIAMAQYGDHHMLVPPTPGQHCGWICKSHKPACLLMDDGSDYEGFISEFYTESVPVRGRVEGQ